MIPLRDENPSRTFPLITILLLIANCAVFIYQFTRPEPLLTRFIMAFGMTPAELLGRAPRLYGDFPAALTLISSQFVHGGIPHLLGNMLFLWIFGNNMEDVLGKFRFLMFYLLSGVIAALGHLIMQPYSDLPMVGASGAIAGVLGAYLITFPRARVLVLVFAIFFITTWRVPAFLLLIVWFLWQFLYAFNLLGEGSQNVAYVAHMAGFLAGMLLVRRFQPGARWRRRWR